MISLSLSLSDEEMFQNCMLPIEGSSENSQTGAHWTAALLYICMTRFFFIIGKELLERFCTQN